jgi:hypothetical protein
MRTKVTSCASSGSEVRDISDVISTLKNLAYDVSSGESREPGTFTTEEATKALRRNIAKVRSIIKEAIENGIIESYGTIPGTTICGKRKEVPVYRILSTNKAAKKTKK